MRTLLALFIVAVVADASVFRSHLQKASLTPRSRAYRTKIAGTEPIYEYYDNYYVVDVNIGTPAQKFRLWLDGTHSDAWVFAQNCTTGGCQLSPGSIARTHFDPAKSSTFRNTGAAFKENNPQGAITGLIGRDVMTIAGLTVNQQNFGLITVAGQGFSYDPMDGTLGLGWPNSATAGAPFLYNILQRLDQPIFTLTLEGSLHPTLGVVDGWLSFGDTDPTHCTDQASYVPATSRTLWQFDIGGFHMDSYTISEKTQAAFSLQPWTGIQAQYIDKIVQLAGGKWDSSQNIYTISCSKMFTAPEMHFNVGGQDFAVPSTAYIEDMGLGSGNCLMAIGSIQSGGFGPSWYFGTSFMRHWCVIFDYGQARLGFAGVKA